MKLTRTSFAALAALALFAPGLTLAQTQAQAPATRSAPAPTMPPATSPSIPTRVAPTAAPTASTTTGTTAAPATTPAVTSAMPMKRMDINTASETELASLPGIGPVTAKAIVDGRPWDDLNALATKKAMTRPVLARNRDHFALADINTSSATDIAKTLPGIGEKTAPKIVAGRPYATPQDLLTKKIVTPAQFAKIKDVITY